MKKLILLFLLVFPIAMSSAADPPGKQTIDRLSTPAACREALAKEKNDVVRRAAFRKFLYNEETFREAVKIGLKDRDPGIRSAALYELFAHDGDKAFPVFQQMINDPAPEVGRMLAELGRSIRDRRKRESLLRELAKHAASPEVRRTASRSIGFSFFRENRPLSENPAHDHEVIRLAEIRLPLSGWAFRTDPGETGHLETVPWFAPGFDDSKWKRIGVTKTWEEQGVPDYDGIAWYRVKFRMPPKKEGQAAELCFGAVDEAAWVWLNGKYIGQHDIGPDGWKVPFRLDVSEEILWNSENSLTVRVEDTELAGGIWKPVTVEVLK